jgi:hypothetical protein
MEKSGAPVERRSAQSPKRNDGGWHFCPKCGILIPGEIDSEEWLICRAMARDTSWAWCEECKERFAAERSEMLAREAKPVGALAGIEFAGKREGNGELKKCRVCGAEFRGVPGQLRCSRPACKLEGKRRNSRRYHREKRAAEARKLQAQAATQEARTAPDRKV